ncbi:Nuclear transport factor 2 [Mucor bainieri]
MADITTIANQFTTYYYQTFDANRQGLAQLYREASMLTFEGQPFRGAADIGEKLGSLPFQKVQHRVSTFDAQPADPSGSNILVFVTGQLLIDDETNPQMFSQTFHLVPENGSYYVFNDIFRLNYA